MRKAILSCLVRLHSHSNKFCTPTFSTAHPIKLPSSASSKARSSTNRANPYMTRRLSTTSTASASSSTSTSTSTTTYGIARSVGREMKIELTPEEQELCQLLQSVTDWLKVKRTDLSEVVLRIAGGWVRDKLLSIPCHDLDIAVDTMMGYDFAQLVNAYLEEKGEETRSIAKIMSNPEKSKHLETATTTVLGMSLDFVNLRNEVYSETSRIPSTITFGTPKEDAYRRDITINALFYNIHTHKVEDFTERGLSDLQNGVIQTPLSPFETFRDDPLRVLRCIRFASRFGFQITPEVEKAACDPDIRECLNTKISRERIWTEVDKMLKDSDPATAINLIYNFQLYSAVFSLPAPNFDGKVGDFAVAIHAAKALRWVEKNVADQIDGALSVEDRRRVYLAGTVLPYRNLVVLLAKGKRVSGVDNVLKEGLKAPHNDADITVKLVNAIPNIQLAVRDHQSKPLSRSRLGTLIRDVGSRWRLAVRLSLVATLIDPDHAVPNPVLVWQQDDVPPQYEHDANVKFIIEQYKSFLDQVTVYGLSECYNLKHICDGNDIQKLFKMRKGLPVLGNILKDVMWWQLAHPEGTKDECLKFIHDKWVKEITSV